MVEYSIETRNLVKNYGSSPAVNSVSLKTMKGSVYGLLGPNGAGKTTIIRTLLGFIRPTSGEALVLGKNPLKHRVQLFSRVGYAPELPIFQSFFTGRELLDFTGRLYGLNKTTRTRRIRELLDLIGLTDHQNKKIGKYSKGMVQRLSVAQCMMNDPELLILDEPTIGLDPTATVHFRTLFRDLREQGKTIFISSHLLDEVERLCTQVAILDQGKLIFEGSVEQALNLFQDSNQLEIELEAILPQVQNAISSLPYVESVQADGHFLRLTMKDAGEHRAEIAQLVLQNGGRLLSLYRHKATLEEAFLQALQKERAT